MFPVSVFLLTRLCLQIWNGTFFEHITLKEIGLRIQLGHGVGDRCINPEAAVGDNFVIIDTNGIHQVGLDFCKCQTAEHATIQLLRARWYPATPIAPNTAATFNVLEYFHLLTFESKASVFEFLHSLMRRTNNTSTADVPVSFVQFIYIFLSMLRALYRIAMKSFCAWSANGGTSKCLNEQGGDIIQQGWLRHEKGSVLSFVWHVPSRIKTSQRNGEMLRMSYSVT
jgi:hypothetical protein